MNIRKYARARAPPGTPRMFAVVGLCVCFLVVVAAARPQCSPGCALGTPETAGAPEVKGPGFRGGQ
eukprot:7018970-Pyramimonas_sp.AAC.1